MENGFGAPSAFLSGDLFPTLTRISFDEHDVIIRFDEEVDGMKFRVEVYTKISVIVFGRSCLLFWRLSFIHYTLYEENVAPAEKIGQVFFLSPPFIIFEAGR